MGEQQSLLDWKPPFVFDGQTFNLDRDSIRLNAQLKRVLACMMVSGAWMTLREIAAATGDPEASVSARLRDVAKVRFGLTAYFRVEKKFVVRGKWAYRLAARIGE